MNFRPPDHRFAHVSLSANAAKENQSYQFRAGRYAIRSTEKLFIYDFRGKGREEEEGKRNYKFPAKRCVFFSLSATEGMLTKITLRATINVSRGSTKRRSRSLRRKRRAQGKRGAFRSRPSSLKKKKKEGAANPRLHSIDEPRFTSPIRRTFSIVTGIHQRCAATRARLSSKTNSFLFILIINLSLLYIYIYMLNRTEIFQTRVKSLPKFFSFPNLAISSSNNSLSLSRKMIDTRELITEARLKCITPRGFQTETRLRSGRETR